MHLAWGIIFILSINFSYGEPLSNPKVSEQEVNVLPEINSIMNFTIDEDLMDQNGFLMLVAFDAPLSKEPMIIGKKIILNNFKKLQASIEKNDSTLADDSVDHKENYYSNDEAIKLFDKIDGERYVFPCSQLVNLSCINDIIKDREIIEQFIQKNSEFLNRYQLVKKMPLFDIYFLTAMSPVPNYRNLIRLSELKISEALFAIIEGDKERGIEILQEEIDFAKRILSSERTSLIEEMVAIRMLLTNYNLISALLDTQYMEEGVDNIRLINLLSPLSAQEQKAIAAGLKIERNMMVRFYNSGTISNTIDKREDFKSNYHPVKTATILYKRRQAMIDQATLVLPESGLYYRTNLSKKETKTIQEVEPLSDEEIIEKYGKDNYYGGFLLSMSEPDYQSYINRLYDLSSYLGLVNAKLKIKQAGVNAVEIENFLIKLAEEAHNPYTHKPFIWNETKQTLSTDWIDEKKYEYQIKRDGTQATIKIQLITE